VDGLAQNLVHAIFSLAIFDGWGTDSSSLIAPTPHREAMYQRCNAWFPEHGVGGISRASAAVVGGFIDDADMDV